jgi:hypothetical protein
MKPTFHVSILRSLNDRPITRRRRMIASLLTLDKTQIGFGYGRQRFCEMRTSCLCRALRAPAGLLIVDSMRLSQTRIAARVTTISSHPRCPYEALFIVMIRIVDQIGAVSAKASSYPLHCGSGAAPQRAR